MIILEGPDGSGKSTLARVLSEALKLPIAPKVVSAQTEAMTDLKKWVEENTARGYQATIFDRHRLISGPIYNAVLGRPGDEAFSNLNWMHLQVTKLFRADPLIIYCLPEFEVVKENVTNGPDDNSAVIDILPNLYEAYVAKAAQDTALGLAHLYDYTESHPYSILKLVRGYVTAKERAA